MRSGFCRESEFWVRCPQNQGIFDEMADFLPKNIAKGTIFEAKNSSDRTKVP